MSALSFRGVDGRGDAFVGATVEGPSTVTERLFKRGVRWAEVVSDGEKVGEVMRDVERPSRRTWWAERDGEQGQKGGGS